MKKTIVVLSFVLFPTLLVAQMPKMIAEEFMSGSKKGLETVAKGIHLEPAILYTPALTGLQPFRSEFLSSITQQIETSTRSTLTRLIANQARHAYTPHVLSTAQLAQIARAVTPVQTFLQGKEDLLRLMATDTAFEFFTPSTATNNTIYARTKKSIDVADPSAASFFTIPEGELVKVARSEMQSLIENAQQIPLASTQRLIENLQNAARSSTGKRNFLFEKEFLTLVEEDSSSTHEFFAASLSGKRLGTSTHLSFVPVKKDISVLTPKGLRFIKEGSFLNLVSLRLGKIEEAITPAYNIEFPEQEMKSFLQTNPDIPSLFSRPGTYTDPAGISHQFIRLKVPFNITPLGTLREGDYLDIAQPDHLRAVDETFFQQPRY